jgi:ankyrin repeat protein
MLAEIWVAAIEKTTEDINPLQKLITKNTDNIVFLDTDGTTPLIYAAYRGHTKAVEILLRNIDLNQADDFGDTPIFVAASAGRVDVVRLLLLQKKIHINKFNKKGMTALWIAAQNGHTEVVNALCKAGANIDLSNHNNTSPLFMAVQQNHVSVIKILLAAGAKLEQANNQKITPILMAITKQNPHIIALLKNEVHARIFSAVKKNNPEALELLLNCEFKPEIKECLNDKKLTPIFVAVKHGCLEVLNVLIKAGANVHWCNEDGLAPVWVAAEKDHFSVVDFLVLHGANPNPFKLESLGETGNSLFWVAAQTGKTKILECLAKHKVPLNTKNHEGITPLSIAIKYNKTEAVETLLRLGADTDIENDDKTTPQSLAKNNKKISKILDEHETKNRKQKPLFTALVLNNNKQDGTFDLELKLNGILSAKELLMLAQKGSGAIKPFVDQQRKTQTPVPPLVFSEITHSAMLQDCLDKFHQAVKNNNKKMVASFFDEGYLNVNAINNDGFSLLSIAIKEEKIEIVKILLKLGADLRLKNKDGTLPILLAKPESEIYIFCLEHAKNLTNGHKSN